MAKDLLRFITCGSVDDGKSTLIGRLLLDTGNVPLDEIEALGSEVDPALLVDGLSAEREQGITIDVAYRSFSTPSRRFIVADTPGHEQYTRNMVTGASRADAAVILMDARKGLLEQTRRHALLAKLAGVRHFVLAITKMDLAGFDEARFADLVADFREYAARIELGHVVAVPVSGALGSNVVSRDAERMGWYGGPTLLKALDAADVSAHANGAFRMPVQRAHRPSADFRGVQGQIASGAVRPGDRVRLLPSGRSAHVERIVAYEGDMEEAVAGQSVTLTFANETDCSRGEVIADALDPPEASDQFEADLVWLDDAPLLPGRAYWLKLGTQTVSARVQPPKYKLDLGDLSELAAKTLELNDIGRVQFATDRDLVFEPFEDEDGAVRRTLGRFILIDKESRATAAVGMIRFALRRATNVQRQALDVDRAMRSELKGQRPAILWFTGLSGAGKSTIANLVEQKLSARGRHTFLLDGDNVRLGLNRDLGFTDADRIENIRRIGEVARLMTEAGLIVLTAFISPFRAERAMVREMVDEGMFFEVFIDTPLSVAEERDEKGLYAKARAGKIANFTGIDSPYEPPEAPELRIDTTAMSADEAADAVVDALMRHADGANP
ncbi:adenylyl-sulfate kinase [Sphingomicrobium sp. XHP0235]|uniref:adenylyl-sulfate kinase n=1 Tax=Sphingomicrobium aquimarinum TaxID=3133971 RepID=UPI0031FF4121